MSVQTSHFCTVKLGIGYQKAVLHVTILLIAINNSWWVSATCMQTSNQKTNDEIVVEQEWSLWNRITTISNYDNFITSTGWWYWWWQHWWWWFKPRTITEGLLQRSIYAFLTIYGLHTMRYAFHKTFPYVFWLMKMIGFWFKFHWNYHCK